MRTFLLFGILLDLSDFIIGTEKLEIMTSMDKVEARDELLGELETMSAIADAISGEGQVLTCLVHSIL